MARLGPLSVWEWVIVVVLVGGLLSYGTDRVRARVRGRKPKIAPVTGLSPS